jgi:hypothetical protein
MVREWNDAAGCSYGGLCRCTSPELRPLYLAGVSPTCMSWHGELLVALRSGPKFIRMAKAQGGAPLAEACNFGQRRMATAHVSLSRA